MAVVPIVLQGIHMKWIILAVLIIVSCKPKTNKSTLSHSMPTGIDIECSELNELEISQGILSKIAVENICKSLKSGKLDELASEIFLKASEEKRDIQLLDFETLNALNYRKGSTEGLALAEEKNFWVKIEEMQKNLQKIHESMNLKGLILSDQMSQTKDLVQNKVFSGVGVSGGVSILGYKGLVQSAISVLPFIERQKNLPNYIDGNLLGIEAVLHPNNNGSYSLGIFIYPGIIKSAGLSVGASYGSFVTSGCTNNQAYTGHFLTAGITFPTKIFAGASMAYSAGANLLTIKSNIDAKGGVNWAKAINELSGIESPSDPNSASIVSDWMLYSASKSLLATVASAVGEGDAFELSVLDLSNAFKINTFNEPFSPENTLEPMTFMPSSRKALTWFYELVKNSEGADASSHKTDLKKLIVSILDGGLSECDSLGVSIGPAFGVGAPTLGQVTNYTLLGEIDWDIILKLLTGNSVIGDYSQIVKFHAEVIINLFNHVKSGQFWALDTP